MNNPRRDSPSYHRNIEPITSKLHELIPKDNIRILEIGSGSGQHVAYFSKEFPQATFLPTDYEEENLASINAWTHGQENILPAQQLDAKKLNWFGDNMEQTEKFDVLLCFNVIHITPWEVTQSIFNGANKVMNEKCQILFYGPFRIKGKQTSESNADFEKWLKAKDMSFGVRDIDDVKREAKVHGFDLVQSHPMPGNNFINAFART